MKNADSLESIMDKANLWLSDEYDTETQKQVKHLIDNDKDELTESFYRDLEFGTGGLRGIMGVGTNRMNIYTVGKATQGLCNYLLQQFPNQEISVAIAHDCRNNSRLFAEKTAEIFSANNIKVYLFDALRPTPELSFAIRHFGCKSGVVITASHNPKEYNGYKVYWEDGGQIVAPHDKNIINEVLRINKVSEVKFEARQELIKSIGDKIDEIYTDKVKALSLHPEIISKHADLKIVYTPIHGTGVKLVPMILQKFGFTNIYNIPEQDEVNGDFPTVHSPNPEEPAALQMAMEKAKSIDADLVMATDPDADRVGIAVKDNNDDFILLNGNQTAAILIDYLLSQWDANGKLDGKQYIVKTIVTTELLSEIAKKYKVETYDVLTGFKFIADIIKKLEGEKTFIGGGEESYGYLAGEFVRDKDAVMSCALIAEAAAFARENGKSLYQRLIEIYAEYGFYKEKLISVTKKGKAGAEEIQEMMKNFRENPPKQIAGSKTIFVKDYNVQEELNLESGEKSAIDLPKSNVLQFISEDETKISVRPSGTEPKIKFYFGVKSKLTNASDYEKVNTELDQKIDRIINELNLK